MGVQAISAVQHAPAPSASAPAQHWRRSTNHHQSGAAMKNLKPYPERATQSCAPTGLLASSPSNEAINEAEPQQRLHRLKSTQSRFRLFSLCRRLNGLGRRGATAAVAPPILRADEILGHSTLPRWQPTDTKNEREQPFPVLGRIHTSLTQHVVERVGGFFGLSGRV